MLCGEIELIPDVSQFVLFFHEMKRILCFSVVMLVAFHSLLAQNTKPVKVFHAEPLFMDLVRDLGGRKGEKEVNVAADFSHFKEYNHYMMLAEYEFVPVNRLGVEAETDFSFFHFRQNNTEERMLLVSKLECLRLSLQYSFLVLEKHKTTLAVGYTQIIEGSEGLVYNPFFIGAKRWGERLHSLIYVSPLFEKSFNATINLQVNTSLHYAVFRQKHFVGVEINKEIHLGKMEMTIRPQVKVKISHNLAVGAAVGFLKNKGQKNESMFFRVIYEL